MKTSRAPKRIEQRDYGLYLYELHCRFSSTPVQRRESADKPRAAAVFKIPPVVPALAFGPFWFVITGHCAALPFAERTLDYRMQPDNQPERFQHRVSP